MSVYYIVENKSISHNSTFQFFNCNGMKLANRTVNTMQKSASVPTIDRIPFQKIVNGSRTNIKMLKDFLNKILSISRGACLVLAFAATANLGYERTAS